MMFLLPVGPQLIGRHRTTSSARPLSLEGQRLFRLSASRGAQDELRKLHSTVKGITLRLCVSFDLKLNMA